MPSPAALNKLLPKHRCADSAATVRGSAAVEFALVAPVFFALLFAIIETAIMFFASQVLETITQDSARMLMTGQAQTAGYTRPSSSAPASARPAMPAARFVLFNCANLYVDVESYPAFSSVTINSRSTAAVISSPPMQYNPGRRRRHRRGATVLSMAAVRHRLWLQHLESVRQQAAADRHGRVPERALLETDADEARCDDEITGVAAASRRSNCVAIATALRRLNSPCIVPIMLVLFFGTVEFSSGVAVDRKVTLMARTLSDLTSQSTSVTDTDLSNFFAASTAIMTPYRRRRSQIDDHRSECRSWSTLAMRGCNGARDTAPRAAATPRSSISADARGRRRRI